MRAHVIYNAGPFELDRRTVEAEEDGDLAAAIYAAVLELATDNRLEIGDSFAIVEG